MRGYINEPSCSIIYHLIYNHLIYSYFIHYSYMDYYVIFEVFWIILVWVNFVRLIWYQSFVFLIPAFGQFLIRPCLIWLLANSIVSEFLWENWYLTINQAFGHPLYQILSDLAFGQPHRFRVSLRNLVVDHRLGLWPFKFSSS